MRRGSQPQLQLNPIFEVCIGCHLEFSEIRVFEDFIPGELIVQSFLAGLGGIALVGSNCHFCQLTLFGDHALKMVIFGGFAAAVAHCAGDLPIARHGGVVTPA